MHMLYERQLSVMLHCSIVANVVFARNQICNYTIEFYGPEYEIMSQYII